jgi:hypothetical protein
MRLIIPSRAKWDGLTRLSLIASYMIEITESRPISKTKNWVATRLVQKAIEV